MNYYDFSLVVRLVYQKELFAFWLLNLDSNVKLLYLHISVFLRPRDNQNLYAVVTPLPSYRTKGQFIVQIW